MVYLLLIVGLALLAYGGDMLVSGSVTLAKKLGVSPLLIGLTLVGFGTSTPELITSLIAVFKGVQGIALGNVIGSNIANILLVLGVTALIMPVKVDMISFKRDGLFLTLSVIGLIAVFFIGRIGFMIGSIFVGLLLIYILYSYQTDKKNEQKKSPDIISHTPATPLWIALLKTIGGISLTMLGAKLLVDNSIILARTWGVSETVIGLTVVAIGTSLPELATSIMSSIRGHNDIAFGNVVGSNIYNTLFILGLTALFLPITIPTSLGADIVLMSAVTAVLIGVALWRKTFSRSIGFAFLCAYAGYTCYLYTLPTS